MCQDRFRIRPHRPFLRCWSERLRPLTREDFLGWARQEDRSFRAPFQFEVAPRQVPYHTPLEQSVEHARHGDGAYLKSTTRPSNHSRVTAVHEGHTNSHSPYGAAVQVLRPGRENEGEKQHKQPQNPEEDIEENPLFVAFL